MENKLINKWSIFLSKSDKNKALSIFFLKKLIGMEGARLLWDMREAWDPAGGTTRRLRSRPMESEHL